MKLPKEDIFTQVKVYIGAVKPILIQQIGFHLYLAYGASKNPSEQYIRYWKDNRNFKGIDFLINSLEIHRDSTTNFAKDVRKNKELFQEALYSLLELLNKSVKFTETYDINGLNLIFAFHKDIEKLIHHVVTQKV